MLGWIELIYSVVDFSFQKITSNKKIQSQLDRTKSIKIFIELYYSLNSLNQLTEEMIEFLEPISSNKKERIYKAWLKASKNSTYLNRLNDAEKQLRESIRGLIKVSEIYDFHLSSVFSHIQLGGEFGEEYFFRPSLCFETVANSSFEFRIDENIKFYTIKENINLLDEFEECYLRNKKNLPNFYASGIFEEFLDDRGIPDEDFLLNLTERIKTKNNIEFDDKEKIIELRNFLINKSKGMDNTISVLNEFLRKEYTIDDLLFVK